MNKRMRNLGLVVSMLVVMLAGNVMAGTTSKDVTGTWNYEAPAAPYEYSKGQLIFTEADSKLDGKIKIGNYEMPMRNLKLEGENMEFGTYVEGEYITIKLKFNKKEFIGTANTPDGPIEVKGKKE